MDIEHQFKSSEKDRLAAVNAAGKIAEYQKYPGREAVDEAERVLEQNRKWGNRVIRNAINGLDQVKGALMPLNDLRKRIEDIFLPPLPEDPNEMDRLDEIAAELAGEDSSKIKEEAETPEQTRRVDMGTAAVLARASWGFPLALGALFAVVHFADLRNQSPTVVSSVSASSDRGYFRAPTVSISSVGGAIPIVTFNNKAAFSHSEPGSSKAPIIETPAPAETPVNEENDLREAEKMIQSLVGGDTAQIIMTMIEDPASEVAKNLEIDHNLGLNQADIAAGHQKVDYRLSFPGRIDMPNQFPRFLSIKTGNDGQVLESTLQFRDINGNLDLLQEGNIDQIYDSQGLEDLAAKRFAPFDKNLRWFHHSTGATAMVYEGAYQTTYTLSKTGNVYIKHELRPTSPLSTDFPTPPSRRM